MGILRPRWISIAAGCLGARHRSQESLLRGRWSDYRRKDVRVKAITTRLAVCAVGADFEYITKPIDVRVAPRVSWNVLVVVRSVPAGSMRRSRSQRTQTFAFGWETARVFFEGQKQLH